MLPRKTACILFILFLVECTLAQKETIGPRGEGFPVEQFRRRLEAVPHYVQVSATAKSDDALLFSDPEDGGFSENTYSNKYFGLSLSLPPGWRQAYQQPPPAASGYYVLNALKFQHGDAIQGTLLITASDLFFSKPMASPAMMIHDLENGLDSSQHVEGHSSQLKIGGQDFVRLDYGSADLHRVILATEIRCHILSFVLTSPDTQLLADVVQSMSEISLRGGNGSRQRTASGNQEHVPPCVKDYATEANLVRKVLPKQASNSSLDVPVRIIIGADGKPKHIHVIAALPEQAESVLAAVSQWTFKPGNEVETGLLLRFTPR